MKNQGMIYEVKPFRNFREMLAQSVEEYAELTAVLYADKQNEVREITYERLYEDVKSFAAYLNSKGLQGKKVAVMGVNSYPWMLTYLAVTCGVGVVVPIDKELKCEDLGNILTLSGTDAILYDEASAASVEAAAGEGIMKLHAEQIEEYLAEGAALREGGDRSFEQHHIDSDALSVLIYTSGTTGVAKGVMLSQYNICSNIIGTRGRIMVYTTDRALSVLPLHHTFECMAGFLTFLSSGASIAISRGLRHFIKELQIFKPSVLVVVPLLLETMHAKLLRKYADVRGGKLALGFGRTFSRTGQAIKLAPGDKLFRPIHDFFGGNLKRVLVGAAALSPATTRDFESFGFKVYCGYGLTETSPVCIVHNDFNRGAGHIGKAIVGVSVKLDRSYAEELGSEAEEGVGEIIVRGPNVMLGYYNNPEETEKVIRDGWFHTGDLAKRDENGNYIIVGRIKNMIVTQNGKKIFPEEMEYYLDKCRFIADSMVGSEPDGRGDVIVNARVYPDYEQVNEQLATLGITPESEEYSAEVKKLIAAEVTEVNKKFPAYKSIKNIYIRREEFVKTSTKKIKRADPRNYTE